MPILVSLKELFQKIIKKIFIRINLFQSIMTPPI